MPDHLAIMNLPPGFRVDFAMFAFLVLAGIALGAAPLFIGENLEVQDFPSSATPGGGESANLGVTATRAYKDGAGAGVSRAIVLSATLAGSMASSLAAMKYQNGPVTGNDSSNPADYFQFDATGSMPSRRFQLIVAIHPVITPIAELA